MTINLIINEQDKYASLDLIEEYLNDLPKNTKIILDGDNILDYPDLNLLIWYLADQRYLTDINIHEDALMEVHTIRLLHSLQKINKLQGINISGSHKLPEEAECLKNICRYLVCGKDTVQLLNKFDIVKVIGCKDLNEIEKQNIEVWKKYIKTYSINTNLSFDKLAMSQLDISIPTNDKTLYVNTVNSIYYINGLQEKELKMTTAVEDYNNVEF